jgi:hypothetical protein
MSETATPPTPIREPDEHPGDAPFIDPSEEQPTPPAPPPPPTDQEVATAASIRAASTLASSTPPAPDTSAVDVNAALLAQAPPPPPSTLVSEFSKVEGEGDELYEAGKGLIGDLDARLHVALGLAKQGLSFASINDLAKAVLLMLDVHTTPDPAKSLLAMAAARGEEPSLL